MRLLRVSTQRLKMNEIESLIKQAKATKARWRKPIAKPTLTNRTMQELLEDAPYPHLRHGKL